MQMHYQLNNVSCCETESKAALEKTCQEGKGLVWIISIFNSIFGFLLIVSIVNVYIFGLEQILNIVHHNWLTINDFSGGGEISPPLGV